MRVDGRVLTGSPLRVCVCVLTSLCDEDTSHIGLSVVQSLSLV